MTRTLRTLAVILAAAILTFGVLSGSGRYWILAVFASAIPIGYLVYSMIPRQIVGWRRNTSKISATLIVCFVLLSMQLLYQQAIVAPTLATQPISTTNGNTIVNPRVYESEIQIQRGRIYDRTGREIAGRIVNANGLVRRTHPVPDASNVLGYNTPSFLYGNAGLEAKYNDYLTGNKGNSLGKIKSQLLHEPLVGDDMYLTLDANLQELGNRLLGNRKGAIVVMNPQTGEVLALVSNPSYNANVLTLNPDKPRSQESRRIQRAYQRIVRSNDGRLLNRPLQGLYPPGSTFKTVTAAAALDSGKATPDETFHDDGSINVEGNVIEDPNRPDKSRTEWTLSEAYQYSLNAVFVQLGERLGQAGLTDYGHRFMYDRDIPFDLPISRSQLANQPSDLNSKTAIASTAFGQGEILATPIEIALNTAVIANGGVMPTPYLVSKIKNPSGDVVFQQGYKPLNTVIKPETASTMKDIMVKTVDNGSGYLAQIPGIKVGGKTGTAQLGTGQPDAWFTAFAPAENPKVVVTVIVERGGEGYSVAAPIAKQLLMEALNVRQQG